MRSNSEKFDIAIAKEPTSIMFMRVTGTSAYLANPWTLLLFLWGR